MEASPVIQSTPRYYRGHGRHRAIVTICFCNRASTSKKLVLTRLNRPLESVHGGYHESTVRGGLGPARLYKIQHVETLEPGNVVTSVLRGRQAKPKPSPYLSTGLVEICSMR